MNNKKALALGLALFLSLNSFSFAQTPSASAQKPNAAAAINSKTPLKPEEMGRKFTFDVVATNTHSDDLKVTLAMVNDPRQVKKYFDGKLWRKRFVPFYLTLENTGHYPIEVSTGSIMILEEKDPLPKNSAKMTQLSSTKPASKPSASSKKKKKALPPFVSPTPPGIVFNKAKHIQYGWKSNLGMLALTGVTLGLAAPVTLPAMVVGNMHRGTNTRLAANFQDQSLARLVIEPGDRISTWLFYRRDRKKQTLVPRKVVFGDIYTPAKEEVSSFVIDLQPLKANQPAVRRALEDSEVKDLQLFQGKIVADAKEEQTAQKLKGLDSLSEPEKQGEAKENGK